MTDDLSHAYARRTPAPPHVDEETWERLMDGDLETVARDAAVEHILACRECTDVYRGLVAFEEGAAGIDEGARRQRFGSRSAIGAMALAASLVAAVVLWRVGGPGDRQAAPGAADIAATRPERPPARPDFTVEKLAVRVSAERALVFRSPGSDQQPFLTAFGRAIEPYRADRFETAAAALHQVGVTFPDAVEAPLFEGVSLLMLKRPADAVPVLSRARTLAGANDLARDAEYYHAVALFGAGDPAGRGALQRLCDNQGTYQTHACKVLGSVSSPPR